VTLDEIRAGILARHTEWEDKARFASGQLAMIEAELLAHDRAVTAMPEAANGNAKPGRAARRDIAALVRAALTDEPQTVAQIAEKTAVVPGRVVVALKRIGARLPNGGDGWAKP
jgi:hypothetical protein